MQGIRRIQNIRILLIAGIALAIVFAGHVAPAGHAASAEHQQINRMPAALAPPPYRLGVNAQAAKQRPVNGAYEASIVVVSSPLMNINK